MHVLEDQRHGPALAEHVEQLDQRLEQAQLSGGIVSIRYAVHLVKSGEERTQLNSTAATKLGEGRIARPNQRAQRARQRRVRELAVLLLDRLPTQREHVLIGEPVLKLADQPRLAADR